MHYRVFTDGGARGNPGPAAIGVVIANVTSFGKKIGETTNNVAEYMAVVEALTFLANKKDIESIQFFLDSTLVTNQLNGIFKVKEPHLRELLMRVRQLEGVVGGAIQYHVVPREKNWRADRLVNLALDS